MTITSFLITPGIRINCRCSRSPSHQTMQVQGFMDYSSSTRELTPLIQGRGSSDQKCLATCAQVSKNGCAVSASNPMTSAMNGWGRETHPHLVHQGFWEQFGFPISYNSSGWQDGVLVLLQHRILGGNIHACWFWPTKTTQLLELPVFVYFCVKLKNHYFNNLTITNPTMFHLRRERLAGLVTVTKGGGG